MSVSDPTRHALPLSLPILLRRSGRHNRPLLAGDCTIWHSTPLVLINAGTSGGVVFLHTLCLATEFTCLGFQIGQPSLLVASTLILSFWELCRAPRPVLQVQKRAVTLHAESNKTEGVIQVLLLRR